VPDLSIDDFFEDKADSRRLFEAVFRQAERLGDCEMRVSKSQIAFRRKKNFALVWAPGQYLKGRPTAPLVLTVSFAKRDLSLRWKEVTEIGPKRFTHHLELYGEQEVDEQVFQWLQKAWNENENEPIDA
jgi:predicted transport protein